MIKRINQIERSQIVRNEVRNRKTIQEFIKKDFEIIDLDRTLL